MPPSPPRWWFSSWRNVWKIEPTRLDEARPWLDHIEGWDEALSRLKASLERET